MTSKTSYNNIGQYMWQQLRATRSFILLVAVVYMLIGPVLLAFQMNSLGMATNPLLMLKVLFKDYYFVYYLAAIVLATFGGFYITRYQNVQKQSNFYHSLPVSRGRLLGGRVLALVLVQILLLLIVIVTGIVASVIFAARIGGNGVVQPLVASAGLQFVYIMLVFLLALAVSLFAGQLTASTVGQILMTMVLHGTIFLISGVASLFLNVFAETYYGGGWTSELVKFNIFYLFYNLDDVNTGFGGMNPLMEPDNWTTLLDVSKLVWPLPMLLISVGLTAALFVATFLLYRRRAVEKAGDTLMFTWVGSFIKGIYVLCGGLFGGFALFGSDGSMVAFVVGVLIAAVIIHIVTEMIYSQDVNGIRQHWPSTIVPVVVALGMAFLFHNGMVSYDDHLPKADRIDAAAIAYNRIVDDDLVLNTAVAQDPETINKVAAAMEAANAANVSVKEFKDDIVPIETLMVSYKTALGGQSTRYYNVSSEDAAKIMAPFINDTKYYETLWSSLATLELENVTELAVDVNGFADFASVDSMLTLIGNSDVNEKMSERERTTRLERSDALLQAMKNDLKKRNATVLSSRVVGYVNFSGSTDSESFWGQHYPIYADDTATVALLQEWRDNGILPEEKNTLSAALTGMQVQTVIYDDSEQGYTVNGTMSNEDFINAWLAGDFVYTDQADRYGFDVDKKRGVIIVDNTGDSSEKAINSDTEAPSGDVIKTMSSYASFYNKNKIDS